MDRPTILSPDAAAPVRIGEPAGPRPALGVADVVALVVGIVVGAGIFRTPSLVAGAAASEGAVVLAWLLGGVISLVGATCYAELATTYPHAGGEYHYLSRAFGRRLAFLFAWARLTVIPTGSIALVAYVFGDYATQLAPLGGQSAAIYAAVAVVALTAINVKGITLTAWTQNVMTIGVVLGLVAIIVAGFTVAAPQPAPPTADGATAWGLVMIFVLLTYGGWNEAAYISAEVRGGRRNVAWALIGSLAIVTALYVLVNVAFLRGLGLHAMGESEAVAADLMGRVAGAGGAQVLSVIVCLAALTTANATTLMGARTRFALGRDFPLFAVLGRWNERAGAPVNALLVQGAIALGLVALGTLTRKGFETMVEYTAPVFWFFFMLTGAALLVLRAREPATPRPFRVPLYPLTPLVFTATCGYLLYSSVVYTGIGAAVGVAVLAAGLLPLWLNGRVNRHRKD
jgi:basic amino acid/polyamine antiporter, APA family